jgi:archaellum component FlaF (FlaF/FlaG flagellin family)
VEVELGTSVIISEAYLTVAVIISASVLSAAFYSSLQRVADAQREKSIEFGRSLGTSVRTLFAAKFNSTTIKVWVKNIGIETVHSDLIGSKADLFLGPKGNFQRVSYSTSPPPTWVYILKNDGNSNGHWDPGETIEITANMGSTLTSGDYFARYSAYTGASHDLTFTI